MKSVLENAHASNPERRSKGAWIMALIAIQLPWGYQTIWWALDATLAQAKRPLHDFLWDGLIGVPSAIAVVLAIWDVPAQLRRGRRLKNCKLSIAAFFLGLIVVVFLLSCWIHDDVVNVNTPFDYI